MITHMTCGILVIPSVLMAQVHPQNEIPKFLQAKVTRAKASNDVFELLQTSWEFTSRGLRSPIGITDEMLSKIDALAESGNPKAMHIKSNLIAYRGGHKDEVELWLRRSAEAGNPKAMSSLAQFLFSKAGQKTAKPVYGTIMPGRAGGVEPNPKREQILLDARNWGEKAFAFFKAAAESGNLDAMVELSAASVYRELNLLSSRDSHNWQLKAAERGDSRSAYFYAMQAKRQGSSSEAWKWMLIAAEAEELDAMIELGEWYMIGDKSIGLPPDRRLSRKWYDRVISFRGDRSFLEYRANPYGE